MDGDNEKIDRGNSILKIVIAFLFIIAIILLSLIIIIKINNSNDTEQLAQQDIEKMRTELFDDYVTEPERVAEICGNYLEGLEGDARAEMLTECANQIMWVDKEKKYYKKTYDYLIEADEIMQDANSAISIINAAIYYDDNNMEEKYQKIMIERTPEDQLNEEGIG